MIIRELTLLNTPSLVSMLLRTAADKQTPIPLFLHGFNRDYRQKPPTTHGHLHFILATAPA